MLFALVTVLFLVTVHTVTAQEPPPPFNGSCVTGKYPPPESRHVAEYILNLDLPANQRWTKIATEKKKEGTRTGTRPQMSSELRQIGSEVWLLWQQISPIDVGTRTGTRPDDHNIRQAQIKAILDKVISFIDEFGKYAEFAVYILKLTGEALDDMLPQPYADEIRGISNATGLEIGEVVFYNIFYEVFTVCTSVVAQNPSGKLFHARNLDFGLFMGWDPKNRTWEITNVLRPSIINVNWQKGGKTVFKSVHFAGYIGILTGISPGKFTLTMNERFQLNGGYIGILEWLVEGKKAGSWMGFLTRATMETAQSYDEAQQMLATTKMLAPAYFILGGNSPGQACVITRDRNPNTTDIWHMKDPTAGQWYILETNYDHDKKPFFLDDRRTPANICMRNMTQKNVGIAGIFNVLSSKPVLNKLTAYSALMQVNSGHLETWLQFCDDPCMPW